MGRKEGVCSGRPSWRAGRVWAGAAASGLALAALAAAIVPTTLNDFFGPGTQPMGLVAPVYSAQVCAGCHGNFDPVHEPFTPWAASMMGQAARDPVFYACLAIAEQDAAFVGDLCLRCHTPGGWLEGRSVPTNGSGLQGADFEGVTCHACHRMLDPTYRRGVSPLPDKEILRALPSVNEDPHSGQYVVDPDDRRRGPYNLGSFGAHAWAQSPFHRDPRMCATCHDVSNPALSRRPNGAYALNELDRPHPTHDKRDEFPLERTYSEWSQSAFARGPINMGGRFGGNQPAVSTCQDCHMPRAQARGCFFGAVRSDLGAHAFNGGNTWVLRAVRNLYPDPETFLSEQSVNDSVARTLDMLARASDLELEVYGATLGVRIVNQTGHKLPTGYPEGRRMWINVRFFDPGERLIDERGAYDPVSAVLREHDTTVFEAVLGVDEEMARATGLPVGPSFHFALNNLYYKDNRIPPRGFTNAGFASVQAAPVGWAYRDGEHWADVEFDIPPAAARAEVRVFYQTTSKEYIEFLRDENRTNDAGRVAYEQWAATGKSAPALMDSGRIETCYADCDRSTGVGVLDIFDFLCFQNLFAAMDPRADCDRSTGRGTFDIFDFLCFQNAFAAGCP